MQSIREVSEALRKSLQGFYPPKPKFKTRLESRTELSLFNDLILDLRAQAVTLYKAGVSAGKDSIAERKSKKVNELLEALDARINEYNLQPPLRNETRELEQVGKLAGELLVIIIKKLNSAHHIIAQQRNTHKETARKHVHKLVYGVAAAVGFAATPAWVGVPAAAAVGYGVNKQIDQNTELLNPKTTTEILCDKIIKCLGEVEILVKDSVIKRNSSLGPP